MVDARDYLIYVVIVRLLFVGSVWIVRCCGRAQLDVDAANDRIRVLGPEARCSVRRQAFDGIESA